jgi:hypothetical protein
VSIEAAYRKAGRRGQRGRAVSAGLVADASPGADRRRRGAIPGDGRAFVLASGPHRSSRQCKCGELPVAYAIEERFDLVIGECQDIVAL